MRGLAPHLSMKPKASSKKDLKDFKDFDFIYRIAPKINTRQKFPTHQQKIHQIPQNPSSPEKIPPI
jgi:hypothetical protein